MNMEEYTFLTLRSPFTQPIQLLPENWEQIFSYLSPHDFYSVTNSCPEWNELLTLRKPEALFPLVIPLLLDYIPRNTILLIREVCQNANLAVVTLFSDQCSSSDKIFSHNRSRSQPVSYRIIERIRYRFTFLNGWKFLKVFRTHELNPFVTRSISLLVGRPNYDGASIKEMLSLFGRFVWRLYLQCCHGHANHFNLDGEVIRAEIVEILEHVPNLKSLKICTTPFIWPAISGPQPSLPKLENLEYLNLDGTNFERISVPILCQYGNQIRILGCFGTLLEMEAINEIVPNLHKLCVQFVTSKTLKILSEMSGWSLEALKLRMFDEQVGAHEVLEVVNNFSGTLVELDLICNVNYNDVHGALIINSDTTEFTQVLRKSGGLNRLQILNSEWNLVQSKWFREFLFGKCTFLQEICLYSQFESEAGEIENFESELLQLTQMKKMEFWVWERGRFVLTHRKLFTPSLKKLGDLRSLCSQTLQCENHSEHEETQSSLTKSKRTINCCYQ